MSSLSLTQGRHLVAGSWSVATTCAVEARCAVSSLSRIARGAGPAAVSHPDPADLRSDRLRPTPVMLVHGLGANKTTFETMARHLRRAGFTVFAVDYTCRGSDVAGCGRQLERAATRLREETGAEYVDVVAHSLGGVVLAWALRHTWMRDWVRVAITLGSPHRGTPAALLAPRALPGVGGLLGQLHPHEPERPAATPEGPTRWVCVSGSHDVLVPPASAALPEGDRVRTVQLDGVGHLALARAAACLRLVREELDAADRQPSPAGSRLPAVA